MGKMSAEEIINFIANSKKTTPIKVYLKGNLENLKVNGNVKSFLNDRVVVAGIPAKVIKTIDQVDDSKIEIKSELRKF